MSSRAGHPCLSSNSSAWLTVLSDPGAGLPAPTGRLRAADLRLLTEAASAHGVMPIVARNLRRLAASGRAATIVDDVNAQSVVETVSNELEQRILLLAGQSLLLSRHATDIAAALAREAIAANIVKGPVFARRLYPQPADRSFTDIDILVAPASLASSFNILARLGFVSAADHNREGLGHGEYKWLMPGNDLILVEIQTNLIHSPNLGAGIRLCHADLLEAGGGMADDATALLLVAAVHAAAGHQFERLQPVIDVLQAARGAAGPIDRKRLIRVAHATGSIVAVQAALDLAAELFHDSSTRELADTLIPAPWRRLRRKLISPRIVLRAQTRLASRDSWRRRAFRETIRRIGKGTIQPISR